MKDKNFHIITMATYGIGLSGGDRIWIELTKRITQQYPTNVYLWEEGKAIAEREGLKNVRFIVWSSKAWAKLGFFINYFARIFISLFKSFTLELENSPRTIIFSASEFWQDSLPAVILKIRYPKSKWIAAWYQTAPNPLVGFKKKKFGFDYKVFLYWLAQQPIKPLIKSYADLVIVNNDSEKKEFSKMNLDHKVFVILGGIDLDKINEFRLKYKKVDKIYDAVFQGRFHPQKGVVELIDIWREVVIDKPSAKLAMIGDGPLMEEVKIKIREYNLEKSITLSGYLFDGPEKYNIFSQSRVVVHPALFDSGGMASAEAMAFGLPAVGFDLISYKSYYPQGLVKVKTGDLKMFAREIIRLLDDNNYYTNISQEGLKMLKNNWSWDSKFKILISYLK